MPHIKKSVMKYLMLKNKYEPGLCMSYKIADTYSEGSGQHILIRAFAVHFMGNQGFKAFPDGQQSSY